VPCVPLETARALGDRRNGVAEVCPESPFAETKPPPTITMKWMSGWLRDAPRVSRNCRVRAIVRVLSARSAQATTPKPQPATLSLANLSKAFYIRVAAPSVSGYWEPSIEFANKFPRTSHRWLLTMLLVLFSVAREIAQAIDLSITTRCAPDFSTKNETSYTLHLHPRRLLSARAKSPPSAQICFRSAFAPAVVISRGGKSKSLEIEREAPRRLINTGIERRSPRSHRSND